MKVVVLIPEEKESVLLLRAKLNHHRELIKHHQDSYTEVNHEAARLETGLARKYGLRSGAELSECGGYLLGIEKEVAE